MRLVTRGFSVFALAVVVLASGSAIDDAAAQPGEFLLDHYKIYLLDSSTITTEPLRVIDQFGEVGAVATGPVKFGLPVLKRITPTDDPTLFHPTAHLTWYDFPSPQPIRHVVVTNQFGESGLEIGDGRFLLAPALKNPSPGQVPPDEINHFHCYLASGPTELIVVQLEDQFGFMDVDVVDPVLLCNPAEKRLPDNTIFPIVNPEDHLVCYTIDRAPTPVTVSFLDQFLFDAGALFETELLCVPSKKSGVVSSEESTWGRMKSIYR